jgi:hypothetical protein
MEITSKNQRFSLVSSEGCHFDKRQPCEEKQEMEPKVCLL